jgi:hypothetical protein
VRLESIFCWPLGFFATDFRDLCPLADVRAEVLWTVAVFDLVVGFAAIVFDDANFEEFFPAAGVGSEVELVWARESVPARSTAQPASANFPDLNPPRLNDPRPNSHLKSQRAWH